MKIISIDQQWFTQLQSILKVEFEIHSVFSRSVNLIDSSGVLYTLLIDDFPNAPNSLLVEKEAFMQLCGRLSVGEKFCYHKTSNGGIFQFALDTLIINELTAFWHSQLPILDTIIEATQFALLADYLQEITIESQDKPMDSIAQYIQDKIEQQSLFLKKAMIAGDEVEIAKSCQQLIGLGQGLTPSGDDRLLGILWVLYLYEASFQIEIEWLAKGILLKVESTTEVSRSMLLHGIKGRFNEWLQEYAFALQHTLAQQVHEYDCSNKVCQTFNQITSDSLSRELKSLKKIALIGSSSGCDMIAGMKIGMEIVRYINTVQ